MKPVRTLFFILFILLIHTSCEQTTLKDFGLKEQNILFQHGKATLEGVLVKPTDRKTYPVVIFIHGDGPSDRYQNGYYKYIWKQLTNQGIACFSWDKQGVGKSTGNWLNQTMQDRAKEVGSAMAFLKQRKDIENIALWGISQGAWVAPKVYAMDKKISAIVLQSAAVNWMEQGRFHLQKRLEKNKYSPEQIKKCTHYSDASTVFLYKDDYKGYKAHYQKQTTFIKTVFAPMSEKRWSFVVKNFKTDLKEDLKDLNCPLLAVFGDHDENVDTKQSIAVLDQYLKNNPYYENAMFTDADHALINIHQKGKAGTTKDAWYKLLYKGENIFAPGFIEKTIVFLQKQF